MSFDRRADVFKTSVPVMYLEQGNSRKANFTMATAGRAPRPEFQWQLVAALRRWATSLSPAEINTPVISVSGIEYTPRQVLDEIERDTEIAKEFIAGLSSLHEWMISANPDSSVIDLIEASVVFPARDSRSISHEIGTMAGIIFRDIEGRGEDSQLQLADLRKEVGGIQRVFDWAIGWLAKEDKIAITLSDGKFRISLKRRRAVAKASSAA